ncbi:MAG TPA: tetratricopeptide repeat protein [Planctomycetota bacterium]|nr:tetratricopeptide repeat protein [Planctomycetota bacterium]
MTRITLLLALFATALLSCSEPEVRRVNPQLLQEAERAMLQGNWDRAAQQYEQFLSENPGDPQRIEVRTQIGKCRLGGGRPELAIRAFDQALTEGPASPLRWEILFRRAVAYRMMGDAAKAVEGFRAVLHAPSSERGRTVTNDELHFEYATALFRTGDFRAGQAELKLVNPAGPYEKQLAPRLGLTGYTIQVGAYSEQAANLEAAKLPGSRVRQTSGTLFSVQVGSFARYDEAQRELAKLQRQGYTEAFILP